MSPKKEYVRQLGSIFWSFCKISPVTFGGGYAMIPVIEREVVLNRKWITSKEMADVLSVSGSAPGGIGVNAAVFVGYRLGGIPGAASAVTGITLPTFAIVIALSYMYVTLSGIPKVAAAFQGIQCAIVAMIALAGYRMGKQALRDKTTVGLFVLAIALLLFSNLHPMFFIAGGALAGWGAARLKAAKGKPIDFEEPSSGYVDEYGNHYKYSDYFIGDGI